MGFWRTALHGVNWVQLNSLGAVGAPIGPVAVRPSVCLTLTKTKQNAVTNWLSAVCTDVRNASDVSVPTRSPPIFSADRLGVVAEHCAGNGRQAYFKERILSCEANSCSSSP